MVSNTQSVQSNAGKQSWSRTALKRCNNNEILIYNYRASAEREREREREREILF